MGRTDGCDGLSILQLIIRVGLSTPALRWRNLTLSRATAMTTAPSNTNVER